ARDTAKRTAAAARAIRIEGASWGSDRNECLLRAFPEAGLGAERIAKSDSSTLTFRSAVRKWAGSQARAAEHERASSWLRGETSSPSASASRSCSGGAPAGLVPRE